MKRFYSVLKVIDTDGAWWHVVTQSEEDETSIIHLAKSEGKEIDIVVCSEESGKGIFDPHTK